MVILITIFMIIVNVQDHADQIQQKAADLQQITQGDVLIHHTDHLPSVPMSSGSKNQKKTWPPTVSGMPSAFYYITLREKCQTIVSVAFARINMASSQLPSKNRLDKPEKIAYNKSKESTPVDGLLPLHYVKE